MVVMVVGRAARGRRAAAGRGRGREAPAARRAADGRAGAANNIAIYSCLLLAELRMDGHERKQQEATNNQ